MAKIVHIKTNDKSLYNSWAEQMLADKLAKFGLKTQDTQFEVAEETERACKIIVTGIYKNFGNDYDECDDRKIWMPKSAFVEDF